MTNPHPIVIIGSGLAGISVAKEFRKLDATTPLIVITQDDGHFYSKPLLSTALHQAKTPQTLIITDVATLQNQLNANFYCFTTVSAIDPLSRQLTMQSENGSQTITYQKLVFAQGAKPRPLPIVEALPAHFRINSLMDYAQFIEAHRNFKQLAIIGSGLVGCEFAHDLTKSHLSIAVVTPDPYPLFGLVPEAMGYALMKTLSDQGVVFHTQTQVINASQNNQCHLELSSNITLQVDCVLIAIGLTAHTALAKSAGLAVNQGIIVDEHLECSIPNHFALGDCAEIQGECRQYIAPIMASARALAQSLHGNPTKAMLPNLPISLKVESYPIIASPPKRGIEGEWQLENTDNHFQGLFYDKQGLLQGFALSGSYLAKRQALQTALLANVM